MKCKKLLSLFLTGCMLVGMVSAAFAAEETPVPENIPPAVTETIPPVTEEAPSVTEDVPPVTEEVPSVTEDVPPVAEDVPPVTEEDTITPKSFADTSEDIRPMEEPIAANVAKIGDTEYATLEAAVTAARAESPATITLLADVTEDITIPAGADITLEIPAEITLTNISGDTISNRGTLTLTGAGTVDNKTHGKNTLVNYPDGTASLEDGITLTRSKEEKGKNSWYVVKNMGEITIINATVQVTTDETGGGGTSLIANGWYDGAAPNNTNDSDRKTAHTGDAVATLTIRDGNFTGGLNVVKNDDYGVLIIDGGTFSNSVGVNVMNWHRATINGGAFLGSKDDKGLLSNGFLSDESDAGELTVTGGTFTASDEGKGSLLGINDFRENGGTFAIEGGSFTGYLPIDPEELQYTFVITGGTFSDDPALYAPEDYIVTEEEGLFTVTLGDDVAQIGDTTYTTLKAAIEAATGEDSPGTVIKLLADATVSEKITITSTVSIEGNDKTVTGKSNDAGVYFEIIGGDVSFSNMTLTNFGDTAETVGATGVFKIPGTAAETTTLTADKLTVKLFNRGAFDIRNGTLTATDCTVDCDNKADNRLTKGFSFGMEGNGTGDGVLTNCTITGVGSTIDGWSSNGVEVQAGSTVSITGCSITSTKGGISAARNYGTGAAKVNVADTTIDATDYAIRIFQSNNTTEPVQGTSAEVTVESGTYTGDVRVSIKDNGTIDAGSKIILKGGTYSVDPTAFVDTENYSVTEADGLYTVASIQINAATPSIETQPAAATYTVGDTATALSVGASVADGGTLSYQWYQNDTEDTTTPEAVGTNVSTHMPDISAKGTAYYYVVVTNTITDNSDGGSKTATATSDIVAITVNAAEVTLPELPIVPSQDDEGNTTATVGKDDIDSVLDTVTDETPDLVIDSTKDGSGNAIDGAKSSTVTLPKEVVTALNGKATGTGAVADLTVTIDTPVGKVKIGTDVLGTLSATNQDVVLVVEKKDVDPSIPALADSEVYDINFKANDEVISITDAAMTMTLRFSGVEDLDNVKISWKDDARTGDINEFTSSSAGENTYDLTFDVNHLTQFFVAEKATTPPAEGTVIVIGSPDSNLGKNFKFTVAAAGDSITVAYLTVSALHNGTTFCTVVPVTLVSGAGTDVATLYFQADTTITGAWITETTPTLTGGVPSAPILASMATS